MSKEIKTLEELINHICAGKKIECTSEQRENWEKSTLHVGSSIDETRKNWKVCKYRIKKEKTYQYFRDGANKGDVWLEISRAICRSREKTRMLLGVTVERKIFSKWIQTKNIYEIMDAFDEYGPTIFRIVYED